MQTYYRPFEVQDYLEVISLDLRPEDREEIEAATGREWKRALEGSLSFSDRTWVVIHKGKIEAVFGIRILSEDIAVPWFLATKKFSSFAFRFAKKSKEVIQMWKDMGFRSLMNIVYAKNLASINWLKWLGFTVTDEYIYLYDQVIPFRKFYMEWRK